MHADQVEFHLLVLISKYAGDPWRRSLISQTDTEVNSEWGAFSPAITPRRKYHANVRPWVAQSCRPKGFPFTPFRKIAVEGSLIILGNSNWKLFQVGYPVDMNFLRIARLSLGWSLPILQGPTKGLKNTFWPSANIKIKKGKTSFTRIPPGNEREINKREKCTLKSSARMKCRRRKRRRREIKREKTHE